MQKKKREKPKKTKRPYWLIVMIFCLLMIPTGVSDFFETKEIIDIPILIIFIILLIVSFKKLFSGLNINNKKTVQKEHNKESDAKYFYTFTPETIEYIKNNDANAKTINIISYDYMSGHDFEYFCADLLKKNGFQNVEVTKGSGDHGIDILAEKDGITYAIQCKCYTSNIGNSAVQQAHTGKSIYHKDIAVVLTNKYFTRQAIEEATALNVKLWDRDKLNELIKKSNN